MEDAAALTKKRARCGLFNFVFARPRCIRPPAEDRSPSTASLPSPAANRVTTTTQSKNLDDPVTTSDSPKARKKPDRIIERRRTKSPHKLHQGKPRKSAVSTARKSPENGLRLSGELDSMIAGYQQSKRNLPVFRNQGNLKQQVNSNTTSNSAVHLNGSTTPKSPTHVNGNTTPNGPLRVNGSTTRKSPTHGNGYTTPNGAVHVNGSTTPKSTTHVNGSTTPKSPAHVNGSTTPKTPTNVNGKYPTSVMGNVVKKTHEPPSPVSLCRALSTRMDPEKLKILGNEDYRNGRFAEALSLYDAAISIDPNKASYRSNKSAALVSLGKLLEAAMECTEAIRVDPFYQRAHNRLALIYVRFGEAEKALYHFKQAGSDADPDGMIRAKEIWVHLRKCREAKRERDWNSVVKEATLAINAGADSSSSINGLKAEALSKMNRQQAAIEAMKKNPNFDIDQSIKFLGNVASSSFLLFQSQLDLASGRFDEAVAAAERANKLDPSSKEAGVMKKKARAVAAARAYGNELFKAGRYSEACIAYGEGLGHDPYNAVLLCNRGACRSKLGQWEKAVEDCNGAIRVWPDYSKARLRRAHCYAKMGKWRACVEDCELLLEERPDDEEIRKMMEVAKVKCD